jgi:hypothetical protein
MQMPNPQEIRPATSLQILLGYLAQHQLFNRGNLKEESMRRLILVLAITALSVSQLFAARIFGDIKMGDKPVAEGIKVTISAPLKAAEAGKPVPTPVVADTAMTDKFGAYRLNVKEEGKCILTVQIEKQTPTIEVVSYANATRYDLMLEKDKDGKYTLKRK